MNEEPKRTMTDEELKRAKEETEWIGEHFWQLMIVGTIVGAAFLTLLKWLLP